LRKVAKKQTDRQTDRQINKQRRKYNLLGEDTIKYIQKVK